MESSEKSILKTLLYSDIFNYPLKKEEIWKYLITSKKISKKEFEKSLNNLLVKKIIYFKNDYYCLDKKTKNINRRIKSKSESKKKIKMAIRIARYLFFVPTVKFIGITGSVAVENARESDDIDLFIITKKNSVWISRFLILILLQVFNKRRKRNDSDFKNKICLNLLISEDALVLKNERKDLYTAHEIIQIKPLFERDDVFKKFININKWVINFMPNSLDLKILNKNNVFKRESINASFFQNFNIAEGIARNLQFWYMKGHITKESVSNSVLAFHTVDYKEIVLKKYKKRINEYEV